MNITHLGGAAAATFLGLDYCARNKDNREVQQLAKACAGPVVIGFSLAARHVTQSQNIDPMGAGESILKLTLALFVRTLATVPAVDGLGGSVLQQMFSFVALILLGLFGLDDVTRMLAHDVAFIALGLGIFLMQLKV